MTLKSSFFFNSYPKQTVGILREDGVPPVVHVRIRDGLDSGPQQLVPQEGGVCHGVCK